MFFGFSKHKEFVPELYKDYARKELHLIFLYQYNANVKENLKIPIFYAKNAKNLQEIFGLFLKDLLNAPFKKARKICIQSNIYIQNFYTKRSGVFKTHCKDFAKLKEFLRIYFYGICFKTQDLFLGYVYDKISRQNPGKSLFLKDDLIVIEQKLALLICTQKIDTKNLKSNSQLEKALNLICKNSFEALYIIYPKNDSFNHFIKIKHFLCDLNKTMLKLVPYSISNKLIRRI